MVYLLILSAVVSISVFEALIILSLLYHAYKSIRERNLKLGNLGLPLLLYAVPTVLSTTLYTFKDIGKAIERGVFPLIYIFWKGTGIKGELFYRANILMVLCGAFLVPVVFYRFYKEGVPSPLWGGPFEVGNLYALFSLSSLSLYLRTRRHIYILLFVLFIGMVFFSMRRSSMIGLVVSLLFALWLLRGMLSRKFILSVLGVVAICGGVATAVLVQKDYRFKALYEVITGKRALDDATLQEVSTYRWGLFKQGLSVVKKDLKELNLVPILMGHGYEPGRRLEPKPTINGYEGTQYESIFILTEYIERGLIGLLGIIWLVVSYYRSLIRHRLKDLTSLSFLLALSIQLSGAVFTGFWDAMLPLFLVMYRLGYEYERSSA